MLRPLLHGSHAYRRYFAEQLGDDPCYVSRYVLMEYRRSFIQSLIGFYFYLELPTVETVGDAFQLWSHKFRKGELKAVLQLVGQLLDSHQLSQDDPRDLERAKREVGRFIKLIDAKARQTFKDVSKDTTHCARAAVPLEVDLSRLSEDLRRFVDAFGDTKTCRTNCRIHDFILNRHRAQVEGYSKQAAALPKSASNRGFIAISEQLDRVIEGGANHCSCAHCEKIGDAVIALDAPRDMQLEHVDESFEHLCPPIGQPHRLLPSEVRVLKGQ